MSSTSLHFVIYARDHELPHLISKWVEEKVLSLIIKTWTQPRVCHLLAFDLIESQSFQSFSLLILITPTYLLRGLFFKSNENCSEIWKPRLGKQAGTKGIQAGSTHPKVIMLQSCTNCCQPAASGCHHHPGPESGLQWIIAAPASTSTTSMSVIPLSLTVAARKARNVHIRGFCCCWLCLLW